MFLCINETRRVLCCNSETSKKDRDETIKKIIHPQSNESSVCSRICLPVNHVLMNGYTLTAIYVSVKI